jgi:hypothetical protein
MIELISAIYFQNEKNLEFEMFMALAMTSSVLWNVITSILITLSVLDFKILRILGRIL